MAIYQCQGCGGRADKPPLKAVKEWSTAPSKDFGGLGTWTCKNCRGAKVKVKKIKD